MIVKKSHSPLKWFVFILLFVAPESLKADSTAYSLSSWGSDQNQSQDSGGANSSSGSEAGTLQGYVSEPLKNPISPVSSLPLPTAPPVPAQGSSPLPMADLQKSRSKQNQTKSEGKTLRILPLGDSITLGYEDIDENTRNGSKGGYRKFLGDLLNGKGLKFEFVGSSQNGPGGKELSSHEGHSGWRIDHIKDGVTGYGWVKSARPDIVLLHIGTNDMFQSFEPQNSPGRLSALLDEIQKDAPNAVVLVAKIVPWPGNVDMAPYVSDYNNSVGLVVAQKQSEGKAMYAVDMHSSLDGQRGSTDFCADQAHPSAQGYEKMAEVWASAIMQVAPESNK